MDSFLSLASGNPSTTRGQVARALADYRRVVDSLSLGVGSALPQRLHGSTSTGPREDDQLSYVVYGLETDVTGIRVWPEPDADTAGSFPGAGNLVVDVYLDAQRQTGASARVEGQVFDDVATRHGIDSDIVIRAPVAGVRLRARPYLHWQGGSSVPALRFRVIETTLFKRLSADGLDTEVLAPSDIDIVSSSQHDDLIALLAVLRTVGTSVLGFAIAANLSFELFYENLPGEVGRIEPITALGGGLGEAIQAVAGQPLLSFVLLGDLAMSGSFFGGPGERLQGAAFEVAPDHGTAPLPPGTPNPTLPGLALHYHGTRGLPDEVVGLIGLRSDLIRGQGCDCVSAPDPNCVEGAADCPTTPLSCPR